MGLYEVELRFAIDHAAPPASTPLHVALEHLTAVTIRAATSEEAELWADQLRLALLACADRGG